MKWIIGLKKAGSDGRSIRWVTPGITDSEKLEAKRLQMRYHVLKRKIKGYESSRVSTTDRAETLRGLAGPKKGLYWAVMVVAVDESEADDDA